jgi:hypothetical protein
MRVLRRTVALNLAKTKRSKSNWHRWRTCYKLWTITSDAAFRLIRVCSRWRWEWLSERPANFTFSRIRMYIFATITT